MLIFILFDSRYLLNLRTKFEEFLKKILISNAFGIENGGAILGIDEDSYLLVLSFIFVASTFSFELFKTVMSNFVSMVENC